MMVTPAWPPITGTSMSCQIGFKKRKCMALGDLPVISATNLLARTSKFDLAHPSRGPAMSRVVTPMIFRGSKPFFL